MIERVQQLGLEPPLRLETPGRAEIDDRVAAEDDAAVGSRADIEQRAAHAPRPARVRGIDRLLVRGAAGQALAGVGVPGIEQVDGGTQAEAAPALRTAQRRALQACPRGVGGAAEVAGRAVGHVRVGIETCLLYTSPS